MGPKNAGPTALPIMNIDWLSMMTCSWFKSSADTYVVDVRVTKICSREYIVTMDHFFQSGECIG